MKLSSVGRKSPMYQFPKYPPPMLKFEVVKLYTAKKETANAMIVFVPIFSLKIVLPKAKFITAKRITNVAPQAIVDSSKYRIVISSSLRPYIMASTRLFSLPALSFSDRSKLPLTMYISPRSHWSVSTYNC